MRGIQTAVMSILVLGSAAHASPGFGGLRVYEGHASATTEGDITLACDPDAAFRTATDYERWPQIFPTVSRAIVRSRKGDEARVTFVHPDGSRDDLHFKNHPETHTIWFEQIGGDADVHGNIVFVAGDRPETTNVHSSLYADVHGFAGAFVSGGELRHLRQEEVRGNLFYLAAFFARQHAGLSRR